MFDMIAGGGLVRYPPVLRPARHAGQTSPAHQQRDGFSAHRDAVTERELGVHAPVAVHAPELAVDLADLLGTLHELRSGRVADAAEWAGRTLELSIAYAPAFVAQSIDPSIAIVKRRSPADAAVLLGALRAHRERVQQPGTPPEIDAENRYEASLRRALGKDFDARCTSGLALDETELIALTFSQLTAAKT